MQLKKNMERHQQGARKTSEELLPQEKKTCYDALLKTTVQAVF